jgi:hypothetical protein
MGFCNIFKANKVGGLVTIYQLVMACLVLNEIVGNRLPTRYFNDWFDCVSLAGQQRCDSLVF